MSNTFFKFSILKHFFLTKSEQRVQLLWSRRFFRHQDRRNRLISYIDVICVIWCHMRHLMSYVSFDVICAYDIDIWHQPILPILVSKEVSGPQQSQPLPRFCQKKKVLIFKNWKTCSEFFSFINFEDPLYF